MTPPKLVHHLVASQSFGEVNSKQQTANSKQQTANSKQQLTISRKHGPEATRSDLISTAALAR